MSKKFIVHGIYISLILLCVVYAQIQRSEAINQTELAFKYQTMAEESAEAARQAAAQALMAQNEAEQAMKRAEEQRQLSQKALAKCQGK